MTADPHETVEAEQGSIYQPRILIAEDNEAARTSLSDLLRADLELEVDGAPDGETALKMLRGRSYSIFLTDLRMPSMDGMQVLQQIDAEKLPVTVIVMTGHGSIEEAVEAVRHGAYDFLTKPLDPDNLQIVIRRALRARALQDEVIRLREQLGQREAFSHVITKSPKMLGILELVTNLAQTTTTVLIEGETGTGKEMIARALHQASAIHRTGSMIPVNCAALPENLLESELFGHEKGSFTGAVNRRTGRFEQANGGTLFLDEIGEIPLSMQVKLLRTLQERKIERVGGDAQIEIDVRLVAATNRSLADMVKEGTFREDLYYRVNVVRIEVPPLRERKEDILPLVNHFCKKYAFPGADPSELSSSAVELVLNHRWAGNVRELENAIERACVVSRGTLIEPEHFPPEMTRPTKKGDNPFRVNLDIKLPEQLAQITAEFESRYLRRALKKTRGHVGRCAEICGVSRRTITNKIAEYKIDKDELKDDGE